MNILFVCYGNICRSVMAEAMLKNMLKEHNINNITVTSAGTSNEEVGNSIYYLAREVLEKNNIEIINHKAHKISDEEYKLADLVLCMDQGNYEYLINRFGYDIKIKKLTNYINSNKDIDDPWYTRDFDTCYKEIDECLNNLYMEVIKWYMKNYL